jgi:act minimal PKS acyl carrier protein
MTELTLPDLCRILETTAGKPDRDTIPAGNVLDTSFEDLGYDSLAVLQLAVRIELECGVKVAEDRLPELTTPRAVLKLVNGRHPTR